MPHDNDSVIMRTLDAIFAMLKSIVDDEIVDAIVVVWHRIQWGSPGTDLHRVRQAWRHKPMEVCLLDVEWEFYAGSVRQTDVTILAVVESGRGSDVRKTALHQ